MVLPEIFPVHVAVPEPAQTPLNVMSGGFTLPLIGRGAPLPTAEVRDPSAQVPGATVTPRRVPDTLLSDWVTQALRGLTRARPGLRRSATLGPARGR